MDFSQHLLSILIWLPIVGGAALIVIGDDGDARSSKAGLMRTTALTVAALTFLFSAPGWESSLGGFPALSVVPGQFLLKDIVLLAASVSLLGKALVSQPAA